MRRHRRREALTEAEMQELERIAARLHADLTPFLTGLVPTGDHYRAIQRFHAAMLGAVQEITGDEAAWCRVGAGRMPGIGVSSK